MYVASAEFDELGGMTETEITPWVIEVVCPQRTVDARNEKTGLVGTFLPPSMFSRTGLEAVQKLEAEVRDRMNLYRRRLTRVTEWRAAVAVTNGWSSG